MEAQAGSFPVKARCPGQWTLGLHPSWVRWLASSHILILCTCFIVMPGWHRLSVNSSVAQLTYVSLSTLKPLKSPVQMVQKLAGLYLVSRGRIYFGNNNNKAIIYWVLIIGQVLRKMPYMHYSRRDHNSPLLWVLLLLVLLSSFYK